MDPPPSPHRISYYKYRNELASSMSTELESPKLELDLVDSEEEDGLIENMEQEIECPRCYDIMTLSSDFDKLGYFCQECDLLLVMK
jgi:hypothetical protein